MVMSWHSVLSFMAFLGIMLAVMVFCFVRSLPTTGAFTDGRAAESFFHGFRQVFSRLSIWLNILIGAALMTPFGAFIALWGPQYLQSVRGLSVSEVSVASSSFIFLMGTGGLLFGYLSDRLGKRKPVIITNVFLLLFVCLYLFYAHQLPSILTVLLVCLMGLLNGTVFILTAVAKDLVPSEFAASSAAFQNMGMLLPGLILQPIIGTLLQLRAHGHAAYGATDFQYAFLAIILVLLLGCVSSVFLKTK